MSISEEGYSSEVRAELRIAGQVLELAEIGPDHCVLRTPAHVMPGRGKILVAVDGEIQETSVEVLGSGDPGVETLAIHQLVD